MGTTNLAPQVPPVSMDVLGLLPPDHEYRQMYALAMLMKDAAFIPKHAQGNVSSVFYLIATGNSIGAKWEHALRSCYMTPDGKVGFQWDIIAACLLKNGFKVEWPVNEKTGVTCQITRPATGDGEAQVHRESFGKVDADAIQIYVTKDGRGDWKPLSQKFNYKSYAKNMYMARAGMNAARAIAPDVMGGIYLQDELEHLPPAEVEFGGFNDGGPSMDADFIVAEVEPEVSTETTATAAPEETQNTATTATAKPAAATAAKKRAEKPMVPSDAKPATTTVAVTTASAPAVATTPASAEATPATTAPGPTLVKPTPTEETLAMKVRLAPLQEKIALAAGITLDKTMAVVNCFVRGYLGVAKSPQDVKLWKEPITALEAVIDSQAAALVADPTSFGHNLKNGSFLDKKLVEWGWTGDAAASARRFGADFYANRDQALSTWLEQFNVHQLTEPVDIMNFFDVASISDVTGTKSCKGDAITLVEMAALPACKSDGQTITAFVGMIEKAKAKPMAELTVDQIHTAVEELRAMAQGIQDEANKAAAATPPPTNPATDDAGQEVFFGE